MSQIHVIECDLKDYVLLADNPKYFVFFEVIEEYIPLNNSIELKITLIIFNFKKKKFFSYPDNGFYPDNRPG